MTHKTLLNDQQRIDYPAKLFGHQFGLIIEPTIYNMAGMLSPDYHGGYWEMYRLDNGGFLMHPRVGTPFIVRSPNGFEGSMSPQAFGIVVCLFTYSHLSFTPALSDVCGEHYHLLRELASDHPVASSIFAAID